MRIDLRHERFPLASEYDAEWLMSLDMGPNPLWMLEDLVRDLDLSAGMRVLDLGCGRGATSVFLAREFGVEVWATDLWIPAEMNEKTFRGAEVDHLIHAVHADARSLPFDDEFFDAIVSVDSWEYFGTDDHFLPSLLRVLRPGGQIGVATPAMREDPRELDHIPEHIARLVGWEALGWHSAEWWSQQWRLSGLVDVTEARLQESGWDDWLRWARALVANGNDGAQPSVDMLEADRGEFLTFALVSARKALPRLVPQTPPKGSE